MSKFVSYKFASKVLGVEHKHRVVSASKVGEDIKTTTEDLGWYVHLEGHISFYVGNEEPDLAAYDNVIVTIEKQL
jgi:hypothetical protein